MKKGILVINKPKGITSHDVVDIVRQALGMKRVGHAGTLDPLATGVLVVLVGCSTKCFSAISRSDKEYRATLRLGVKTTTGDIDGNIVETKEYIRITREKIKEAFGKFVGEILQIPPMVSAIKYKGKKLYELAHKGIEVKRAPRKIKIEQLRMLAYNPPDIDFSLGCSSGTYVRQLAEDIAGELGCIGCISELQRTRVGEFSIDQAISLDEVTESALI